MIEYNDWLIDEWLIILVKKGLSEVSTFEIRTELEEETKLMFSLALLEAEYCQEQNITGKGKDKGSNSRMGSP